MKKWSTVSNAKKQKKKRKNLLDLITMATLMVLARALLGIFCTELYTKLHMLKS